MTLISLPLRKVFAASTLMLLLLVLFLALPFGEGASAGHEPADKVSAAGSTTEVVGPGTEVVLLSEKVRTSTPSDLILGVTAECSITTEVTTVGNDLQSAEGKVKIWVEIDGQRVPVSTDDVNPIDRGKVVFCNRLYLRETSLFDDEDATIRTFMKTRDANGFNWLALNVGSGIHTIEVKADLTLESTNNGQAMAAVGKRTLIVEPTKAANDEAVTDLAP